MRIEISRDELNLLVDALHVFKHQLLRLHTRNSSHIARVTKDLAAAIENGERTVR